MIYTYAFKIGLHAGEGIILPYHNSSPAASGSSTGRSGGAAKSAVESSLKAVEAISS